MLPSRSGGSGSSDVYVGITRCPSRSSVSEEHVIGLPMSVCRVFRKNGNIGSN